MTQSQTAPIFNYASLDAPVVFHQGKAITLAQLLQTVEVLAETVPKHQHILNLYENRYYFLLGLLLALRQKSISLFPSTVTTHVLTQLKENYTDILLLTDTIDSLYDFHPDDFEHFDIADFVKNNEDQRSNINHHTFSNDSLPEIELQRQIAIIFTSGSTGHPEPYPKLWGDLVSVAHYLSKEFLSKVPDKNKLSAVLATVPAQHMYGLEASIIMPLQNGLLLHADKPFFPQDITHCLEDLKEFAQHSEQLIMTTVISTPLHLKACIKTEVSLPGVKQFISATAPLESDLAQLCETRYSARVMEIFGCTEVGSMAWKRTIESEQWIVLDDISLESDNNNEVHINTSRSIKHFLFNDIVDLIDSKHFLLKGRKEDLINQAGKRTSLSYLNYHLQSYNDLHDACFYQDDSMLEPRLVAFVVLKEPAISEQQKKQKSKAIRNYLQNKIEAVFLPKRIYFVNDLPRNATGKLPLSQLKNLLLQQEAP